ncbi:MAG: D-2-hydroxyacid dehydrogenase, partial [Bryobacteraceae bacterium]|nr:D-2-hydroxyacid dehydrogenase [Bryobacteraceae bacterium]
EHQLIPELIESPVPFTNARGVYKEALGEFAITAALFFAKDIRRLVRNQEAGRWEQFDVEEIRRKTMGIVGYGEIGRAAAQRGKAMGMRIFATRRKSSGADSDGLAERFYPLGERGDMIAESDVIVVSAPLTPETRGLVGEPEIQRMKSSAILINVGRGPVVDETALIRALEERRIRGAGLDVFDEEPLPAGHPFWRMDNVLLSPHSADHTSDWLEQGTQMFVDNFQRFVAGEPLLNIVDKRAGY